jgi:hypothetical protein
MDLRKYVCLVGLLIATACGPVKIKNSGGNSISTDPNAIQNFQKQSNGSWASQCQKDINGSFSSTVQVINGKNIIHNYHTFSSTNCTGAAVSVWQDTMNLKVVGVTPADQPLGHLEMTTMGDPKFGYRQVKAQMRVNQSAMVLKYISSVHVSDQGENEVPGWSMSPYFESIVYKNN